LSGRAPRGLTAGAAHFWRKYVSALVRMGVPVEVDEPALILMAESFSMAVEARAVLAEQGLLTEDEKGLLRKHPATQVFRDSRDGFRGLASDFGMTPSARSKVKLDDTDQLSMADILFAKITGIAPPGPDDPLDEFKQDGEDG
jgi:P27 family predicted phage terminase small subunit